MSQSMPPNAEILEFEPLEEKWNVYELQNQTIIRGRILVTRFARDPNETDPNKIAISSQNVFVVDAPVEQRGQPTGPLTNEEIRNPQGTPIDILTNNEKWGKYRILSTGVVLKVKMVVDDAIRLDGKFDNDGMPQYVLHSTAMVLPDRHANTDHRT